MCPIYQRTNGTWNAIYFVNWLVSNKWMHEHIVWCVCAQRGTRETITCQFGAHNTVRCVALRECGVATQLVALTVWAAERIVHSLDTKIFMFIDFDHGRRMCRRLANWMGIDSCAVRSSCDASEHMLCFVRNKNCWREIAFVAWNRHTKNGLLSIGFDFSKNRCFHSCIVLKSRESKSQKKQSRQREIELEKRRRKKRAVGDCRVVSNCTENRTDKCFNA